MIGLTSYEDVLGLQQYASVDNLYLNNIKYEANLKPFSMEVDKRYKRRNSESYDSNALDIVHIVHPDKRRLSSKDQTLTEEQDDYSTIQYENNPINSPKTLSIAHRYDAQVPLLKKNFRKGKLNSNIRGVGSGLSGLNSVPPTANQQARQLRRASTRQLWSLIRQQVITYFIYSAYIRSHSFCYTSKRFF